MRGKLWEPPTEPRFRTAFTILPRSGRFWRRSTRPWKKVHRDLAATLTQVADQGERVLIHRKDRDVAALVPIEDLALLERIEDQLDVEVADQALEDPENQETIPWEEVKRVLGLD